MIQDHRIYFLTSPSQMIILRLSYQFHPKMLYSIHHFLTNVSLSISPSHPTSFFLVIPSHPLIRPAFGLSGCVNFIDHISIGPALL